MESLLRLQQGPSRTVSGGHCRQEPLGPPRHGSQQRHHVATCRENIRVTPPTSTSGSWYPEPGIWQFLGPSPPGSFPFYLIKIVSLPVSVSVTTYYPSIPGAKQTVFSVPGSQFLTATLKNHLVFHHTPYFWPYPEKQYRTFNKTNTRLEGCLWLTSI